MMSPFVAEATPDKCKKGDPMVAFLLRFVEAV